MSVVQPAIASNQITEIVNYINVYRAVHQSPPLRWDVTIAAFSQEWSYHLLSNNIFEHSKNSSYGENLAYFQGYGNDIMVLLKKSVDNWYNEYTAYDFSKPGFSTETGHFTCLVWKSSLLVGMGISINTSNNSVIVTLNTSPPGNYTGEFEANVLPSVTITLPLPPLLPPVFPPVPVPAPMPAPMPVPAPVPAPAPMPVPAPAPVPAPMPAPMPVPAPMPAPAPAPAPVPAPVPAPAPIKNANIYEYVTSIYNIIYAIQMKQPKPLVINALYKSINDLNVYTQIDKNTRRQIYDILSSITIAVQKNSPRYYITQNLQKIISLLQQYMTQI